LCKFADVLRQEENAFTTIFKCLAALLTPPVQETAIAVCYVRTR